MATLRRISIFKNKIVFHLQHCDICFMSKQTRMSFPTSDTASLEAFQLIHMDVQGLYKFEIYDGLKSFLTLVDDYFRWTWVFSLRAKSDVFEILNHFITMVHA